MRIFPESKTRLAITAVGIFLCLASAVFHKDLLAYSTVAMSLRSDGVSNPLDFREIPEAKTKSVLMSAWIAEKYLSPEKLGSFRVFRTGQASGDIGWTYLPERGLIIVNFPEKDLDVPTDKVMETLSHEYVHHVISTDSDVRSKLYGTLADYLAKYPEMEGMMDSNDPARRFATSGEMRKKIPLHLWLAVEQWTSIISGGGLYPGFEGKDFLGYVKGRDYSEVGTVRELLLEEMFTYCTVDITMGMKTANEGICGAVKETVFSKK